jgi:pyruvate/2-oxoglutarate dehydrogenase complex dihydrolipoamide dehydrogenase (E3) component
MITFAAGPFTHHPESAGADSDEILGFTAFGAEASELMTAVQTAMIGQMPYTTLRNGIFTHPTISEGLTFLLRGTPTPPR